MQTRRHDFHSEKAITNFRKYVPYSLGLYATPNPPSSIDRTRRNSCASTAQMRNSEICHRTFEGEGEPKHDRTLMLVCARWNPAAMQRCETGDRGRFPPPPLDRDVVLRVACRHDFVLGVWAARYYESEMQIFVARSLQSPGELCSQRGGANNQAVTPDVMNSRWLCCKLRTFFAKSWRPAVWTRKRAYRLSSSQHLPGGLP